MITAAAEHVRSLGDPLIAALAVLALGGGVWLATVVFRLGASLLFSGNGGAARGFQISVHDENRGDPEVWMNWNQAKALGFEDGAPVLLREDKTIGAKAAKALVRRRYASKVEEGTLQLDRRTFAVLFPDLADTEEQTTEAALRLKRDGGLWSHPRTEIRISVRLTFWVFVASVLASILIELLV